MLPLNEWPHQQLAEVVEIIADPTLIHRLLDLGVYAGVQIEVLNSMPFQGPLIVKAQGATLALRRGEAACIRVKACKI